MRESGLGDIVDKENIRPEKTRAEHPPSRFLAYDSVVMQSDADALTQLQMTVIRSDLDLRSWRRNNKRGRVVEETDIW